MVGQAGRNADQSIVVEVQLPQMGNVGHSAIFHRADVIVAQAKSAGKKSDVGMSRNAKEQFSCLK